MIYGQFFLGAIIYCCIAFISYSAQFKHSSYFYTSGIFLAIMANSIWLWICKTNTDHNKLILIGVSWDVMLTSAYLLVPILFYNVKLTGLQISGIIVTIVGLVLTHLG